MATIEKVKEIAEKVDAISQNGLESREDCMNLLESLSKLPITVDIITKTQIGVKINNLRKKVSDETVAKRAKNLIKEWKSLVSPSIEPSSSSSASKREKPQDEEAPASKKSRKESVDEKKPEPVKKQQSTDSAKNVSVVADFESATFPPRHLQDDEIRLKSAQLLLSALRNGELPQGTLDPEDLAVNIEEKLYTFHRDTNQKYSAAVRSRVFNLRDKKNGALRENVLTGVVKAEKFAMMTSEEMASPEIRDMRDKFTKESILEHQMSVQTGTPSDMFKCGKCGKKNCTYTQLQTRSSDEPMTTFVFCLECGNRWKFC
ncbi:unnamed protein product [Caenorhabditis angaria]|uniref:Transcription elongation factor n=1 Tax=Caenorhabditis angaria TaxID=860376 RepID=A0A9P1I8X0_9PELO|nr:unnamed protein product [Caenorhabditis angaria]